MRRRRPVPQVLHGGQTSLQIIHGKKEVRTSGALGGFATASPARLQTLQLLGCGGLMRRKPLVAVLRTAGLMLAASVVRWAAVNRRQTARSGSVWSGKTTKATSSSEVDLVRSLAG